MQGLRQNVDFAAAPFIRILIKNRPARCGSYETAFASSKRSSAFYGGIVLFFYQLCQCLPRRRAEKPDARQCLLQGIPVAADLNDE